MKFLYEYQDKTNKRHKGILNAPTRGDAYAVLKAQGIKPIRCEEAPGLFNKVFGKGKRWIVIVLLCGLCSALCVLTLATQRDNAALSSSLSNLNSTLDSPIRRQLLGDSAIIEKGIRNGWSDVFALEGDRFLASFAIPGVPAAVRTTTAEKLKEAISSTPSTVAPESSLSLEARQVLAIVEGMKKDIRGLIDSGWTLRDVGTALARRQDEEIAYYERARVEIETAARSGASRSSLEQLLERRNESLRKIGVRLVSMPENGGLWK